jgi:MoaA/NifB/PqqE/SkfB family radical SAM enzyme
MKTIQDSSIQKTESDSLSFDKQLNESLRIFFTDMLKAALTSPSTAQFYIKTLGWQRKAAQKRNQLEEESLHVPPIMIFSITNRCNLLCKGCFNNALRKPTAEELPEKQLRQIIKEADELGVSFMVISGGEPLVRPEILNIVEENQHIMFIMFTNGTLLNETLLKRIKKTKNLVPLVSLEGHRAETDERRGAGVYERLGGTFRAMKENHLFWGTSITVTCNNFTVVTDSSFVGELYRQGCRLFIFDEYTPVMEGTESWVVTPQQRKEMRRIRENLRAEYKAVFLNLPGDEEDVGGCLAAGRGFIHINAVGNVEPCPFIPYSDTNLTETPLREALRSDFLKKIREKHSQLPETSGGCALWAQREWLKTITEKESKE